MKQKQHKPYWEMNTRELAEATKEFDQEFIADTARPMTAAERARWERIKRRPAASGKVIALRMDRKLLTRFERLARKQGVSRDEAINRALKTALKKTA